MKGEINTENRTKVCSKCRQIKPFNEFYKDTSKRAHISSVCKICITNLMSTDKYKLGRKLYSSSLHRKLRIRDLHLRRKYDITLENLKCILQVQNYKCCICNIPVDILGRYNHVDHDRRDKTIRGVLCHNCNKGIGCFKDNANIIKKALNYLTKRRISYYADSTY